MRFVFLDRDGVINKDRSDYIKSWTEFEFLPRSLEALKLLSVHGYRVIVITNQSVINRKIVTEEQLGKIHDNMKQAIAAHGGKIEAIYHCPHLPEEGCDCRKPKPGLLYRAQADYGLDLARTSLVGDSLKDVQCSRLAGCGKVILVRTGQGHNSVGLCKEAGIAPNHVASDLMAAVQWLVAENGKANSGWT